MPANRMKKENRSRFLRDWGAACGSLTGERESMGSFSYRQPLTLIGNIWVVIARRAIVTLNRPLEAEFIKMNAPGRTAVFDGSGSL
jgi:hypothetical protein